MSSAIGARAEEVAQAHFTVVETCASRVILLDHDQSRFDRTLVLFPMWPGVCVASDT